MLHGANKHDVYTVIMNEWSHYCWQNQIQNDMKKGSRESRIRGERRRIIENDCCSFDTGGAMGGAKLFKCTGSRDPSCRGSMTSPFREIDLIDVNTTYLLVNTIKRV